MSACAAQCLCSACAAQPALRMGSTQQRGAADEVPPVTAHLLALAVARLHSLAAQPTAFSHCLPWLCRMENMIVVGSTGMGDELSSFSNRGRCALAHENSAAARHTWTGGPLLLRWLSTAAWPHLPITTKPLRRPCSPSLTLRRTTVHLTAPGERILSTTYNGWYGEMDGTSMSTPMVAAAAALLQSAAARCAACGPGLAGAWVGGRQHGCAAGHGLRSAVGCRRLCMTTGRWCVVPLVVCPCSLAPLTPCSSCPLPGWACALATWRPSGCCSPL